jgi:hypothetical protein
MEEVFLDISSDRMVFTASAIVRGSWNGQDQEWIYNFSTEISCKTEKEVEKLILVK